MQSTFALPSNQDTSVPSPSFDLGIGFTGQPGKVAIELHRITFDGFSGQSDKPEIEHRKVKELMVYTVIDSSYARAIASAILSAATQAAKHPSSPPDAL